MLSREENEALCRIGPGTLMGDFVRQYWIPFLPARDLPASRRAADQSPFAGRRSGLFPRYQRADRTAGRELPTSRRLAVLGTQRRMRPALRLPRLEIRRDGQLHRHAQRARGKSRSKSAFARLPTRPRGQRRILDIHGPRGHAAAFRHVRDQSRCRPTRYRHRT